MSATKELIRAAKESAWDECVGSLIYPDGTPVQVASNSNPYRTPAHVGTIPPDLLRELDTRGAQARDAVEQ